VGCWKGKRVMLSHGFISQDKGIETALEALAHLKHRFPELIYVILGQIHPLANGDYYQRLVERVSKLELGDRVVFITKYVSVDQLKEYILASDIIVAPYLNKKQIVSGTLTYSASLGRPILATPFVYAREFENCVDLFGFKNDTQLVNSLLSILHNHTKWEFMGKKCTELAQRTFSWSKIGDKMKEVVHHVLQNPDSLNKRGILQVTPPSNATSPPSKEPATSFIFSHFIAQEPLPPLSDATETVVVITLTECVSQDVLITRISLLLGIPPAQIEVLDYEGCRRKRSLEQDIAFVFAIAAESQSEANELADELVETLEENTEALGLSAVQGVRSVQVRERVSPVSTPTTDPSSPSSPSSPGSPSSTATLSPQAGGDGGLSVGAQVGIAIVVLVVVFVIVAVVIVVLIRKKWKG